MTEQDEVMLTLTIHRTLDPLTGLRGMRYERHIASGTTFTLQDFIAAGAAVGAAGSALMFEVAKLLGDGRDTTKAPTTDVTASDLSDPTVPPPTEPKDPRDAQEFYG